MLDTSPKKASFLICEDIRHEAGSKVSLLGVFNEDIVFEKPENSPSIYVLPQLCLYATFKAILTSCDIKIKLLSPSGLTLFETPTNRHPGNKDMILLAVKIGSMQFSEFGTYTVEYCFDQKKIKCTFSVTESTNEKTV